MFFLLPEDEHRQSYGVYSLFASYIIPYMKQVPYSSRTFEILTQLFETGRFGIGEHLVDGEGKLYPTPLKTGFYLHVASGAETVNAYLNNVKKIALKDGELKLFYLAEKINSATLPKGFYCFFHIRSNKRILDELLEKIRTEENAEKVMSFTAAAGRAIEAGGGEVSSAPVELDPYAAGLIQEIREIRIRRKKGLKKYVGKKVELFMLHYLRLCINARQATYTITGDDIHMIDNIKDYIRHNLHTQLSADLLPLKNNMTVEELDAVFTQFHGISLDDYIEHCRIEKAVHSLTTTKQSITLIASVTGFKNYQAFTAYFTAYFGCAPSRFR